MRSFWSDPYLWIHAAGVAVVPIALELCLLGFAVGDPLLPTGLELLLIAAVGILPVLWMQWQRPFYIFSLVLIAVKPSQLTAQQRQLLRFFKTPEVRALTVVTAVGLAVVLWQLYRLAPIALKAAAFLPQSRGLGLLIAAIAFLAANLFLQVPVSVLRVLLAQDARVAAAEPYPLERVTQDFSVLGWQVPQILPPIEDTTLATEPPIAASVAPSIAPPAALTAESAVAAEPVAAFAEPTAAPEPAATAPDAAVSATVDAAETAAHIEAAASAEMADEAATQNMPAAESDRSAEPAVMNPEFVSTSPDATAVSEIPASVPDDIESDPSPASPNDSASIRGNGVEQHNE
jgi:hypothetical protein